MKWFVLEEPTEAPEAPAFAAEETAIRQPVAASRGMG
jgi:hypothetical protein